MQVINVSKLRPIHDNIVVRREKPPETTASGLALSQKEQEQEALCFGRVLKAGPGQEREDGSLSPMPVGPGDRVTFFRRDGQLIARDGQDDIVIFSADYVLAIVDE